MRYFLLFGTIFLLSCGAVQSQLEVAEDEDQEVEPAGSRLPPPASPLEVLVSCEDGMECVTQEEVIRLALGEEAVECFEGLEPGLYRFRMRLSRYGVQLTALQRFPGEEMVCLRGYLGRIGQVGENDNIEFIIRYTPPAYR